MRIRAKKVIVFCDSDSSEYAWTALVNFERNETVVFHHSPWRRSDRRSAYKAPCGL